MTTSPQACQDYASAHSEYLSASESRDQATNDYIEVQDRLRTVLDAKLEAESKMEAARTKMDAALESHEQPGEDCEQGCYAW